MPTSITKISFHDLTKKLIDAPVTDQLQMIIVIPAFAEKTLVPVLRSLSNASEVTDALEVIVLINQSDEVSEAHAWINEACYRELAQIDFEMLQLHVVYVTDIPAKIAGVGFARKLAMDEATGRLQRSGNYQQGIIVNLDADCSVSENYIVEIHKFFVQQRRVELCNIHWTHDLSTCTSKEEKEAIIEYELHLRYFIGMQRYLQLPYAYQTMGSAFAVRPTAYNQVGGMNKRKAGEDFYFIHKFTKKNTVADLNNCAVIPSGRTSFRVPFGTGKAVNDLLSNNQSMLTYHPQSFFDLIPMVGDVSKWYRTSSTIARLPEPLLSYLYQQNFPSILEKLRRNAKTFTTFHKAFFQWFDAFRLMKYLHHAREIKYPNVPVVAALNDTALLWKTKQSEQGREWLDYLQQQHQNSIYQPMKEIPARHWIMQKSDLV